MGATHKRDLRTGRTVWQGRRLPPIRAHRIPKRLSADVIVVGAGISGGMITDALSEAGLRVAIVDRRGAVQGSTAASTALLQYEIDVPLHVLARRIGVERAERLWRRSRLALDALRERARRLELDAELINRDSLYLQGTELDEAGLQEECEARRRAGFEVTFLARSEVQRRFGIRGRAALLGYDNLAADPRRLAAGFLNASLARGARLYAPYEIDRVDTLESGVRARTTTGDVLAAEHLVFATGYELPKGIPRKGHTIASTWAIATRPQPRALWSGQCFLWEASDPYLYLRTTAEGRVICGGEDEEFSDAARRDALLPQKTAALERKLRALLPKLDPRADYAWCGSFGGSATGTPTIGAIPGMRHCYVALGYGGNGITYAMMAAQMLRGLITARGDPDCDLVSFRRKF